MPNNRLRLWMQPPSLLAERRVQLRREVEVVVDVVVDLEVVGVPTHLMVVPRGNVVFAAAV